MKTSLVIAGCVCVLACGGKSVIDHAGAGGSPSTTSSSGNTTSGGPSSSTGASGSGQSGSVGSGMSGSSSSGMVNECADLTMDFLQALDRARGCDTCTDEPEACEYTAGMELTDECACPAAVNLNNPTAVQEAVNAHRAWIDSGCGPLDCQGICGVSTNPDCISDSGGCPGSCI